MGCKTTKLKYFEKMLAVHSRFLSDFANDYRHGIEVQHNVTVQLHSSKRNVNELPKYVAKLIQTFIDLPNLHLGFPTVRSQNLENIMFSLFPESFKLPYCFTALPKVTDSQFDHSVKFVCERISNMYSDVTGIGLYIKKITKCCTMLTP